jgi:hypothetical protein
VLWELIIGSFSHIVDITQCKSEVAKQSSRKKDTYCNYEMDIPKTHGIQIPKSSKETNFANHKRVKGCRS